MGASVTLKVMRSSKAAGVLFLFTLMPPAQAATQWICLRSPNFELYTSAGEKTGRQALQVFEEVRSAFKDILGIKIPNQQPTTIVIFRDTEEFAPYRPQGNIIAYYMSLSRRDFIILQDLLPEHYPMALHEYTHLVIHQAGMKLPLWLNEGFAEFYSTMKPMGNKILVGRVIPGRLEVAEQGLMDLREILKADKSSKAYNEADRMGIFYAESWALVHMLKFSKPYATRFETLLDAIGRGEPSDKALERVYGKPIEAIQADLQTYVRGSHFFEGVIHAKMERLDIQPEVEARDPVDIAVLLAGIEARGPQHDDAVATLEKLAKDNPGKTSPLEALAWIYLTGPHPQFAIAPFQQAVAAGTRDAVLCFSYAVKLRASIPDYDYVAALRRVAEIDPQMSEAQELLADHAFDNHDYAETVRRLHLVKKLERSQAFNYYRMLAHAAFETGDTVEAKSAAERAQQYAATAEERRMAEELVNSVAGGKSSPPSKAPEFPQGP
jgi:tetratricopeptide (TPR) repeat protein